MTHRRSRRRVASAAAATLLPALLLLGACGSGSGDGGPAVVDGVVQRNNVVEKNRVYPYRRDGRYANVLARCALIEFEDRGDACTLATLPFIGQVTASPTLDDVMERVLVTHDWMGERFETLLASRSAELLPLFGSVTSVVIGSTVRPSYYTTTTGGIQLDPGGLWLTVTEKANISIKPDSRDEFRVLLDFRDVWQQYRGGDSIFGRFGLEDESERTFADIELPIMSLMFHELAHANDFLPPGAAERLDTTLTPREAIESVESLWLSPALSDRSPLNSELLYDLAGVTFFGDKPTAEQRTVSGTVAGAEMASDGATNYYSYSTIREDFANLFETLQMKRLFDVDMHTSFTSQPGDPEDFFCDELVVEWGVLNRLGNPTVLMRAREATDAIYGPDPTLDGFLAAQQDTEIPMETGVGFCTNLDRAGPPAANVARSRAADVVGGPMHGSWRTNAERHAIVDAREGRR